MEELLAVYDSQRRELPAPVTVWEWGWTKSAETWNGRAAMLAVLVLLVLEVTTGEGFLHQWGILPLFRWMSYRIFHTNILMKCKFLSFSLFLFHNTMFSLTRLAISCTSVEGDIEAYDHTHMGWVGVCLERKYMYYMYFTSLWFDMIFTHPMLRTKDISSILTYRFFNSSHYYPILHCVLCISTLVCFVFYFLSKQTPS